LSSVHTWLRTGQSGHR